MKWNNVKKDLPEYLKTVLVFNEGYDQPIMQGHLVKNGNEGFYWRVYNTNHVGCNIEYWMHLPLPPKENSNQSFKRCLFPDI